MARIEVVRMDLVVVTLVELWISMSWRANIHWDGTDSSYSTVQYLYIQNLHLVIACRQYRDTTLLEACSTNEH